MLFKDLKQRYAVFILNKTELKTQQAKVIAVGQPYFPTVGTKPQTAGAVRMVDVTLEASGVTKTYVIPEHLTLTYEGDNVLTTDKTLLLNEVRALKSQSDEIVASCERNKERSAKCDELIAELDSDYRERIKSEQRVTAIEKKVDDLAGKIDSFINKLNSKMQ